MNICEDGIDSIVSDVTNENIITEISLQNNESSVDSKEVIHLKEKVIDENHQQSHKSKSLKKSSVIIVVLSGIVIVLSFLCMYFYNSYSKVQKDVKNLDVEITSLKKQNSDYKKTNEELKERNSKIASENLSNYFKLNFYDKNIVFVIDGYGKYYYTYDQMKQVTQGIDEYGYWAYNKEQAIGLGYKAWK